MPIKTVFALTSDAWCDPKPNLSPASLMSNDTLKGTGYSCVFSRESMQGRGQIWLPPSPTPLHNVGTSERCPCKYGLKPSSVTLPILPQVWEMPHDLALQLPLKDGNKLESRKGLQKVGYRRFVSPEPLPSISAKFSLGVKFFNNSSCKAPNSNPTWAKYYPFHSCLMKHEGQGCPRSPSGWLE